MYLCPPITSEYRTCDEEGKDGGRILKFVDQFGAPRELYISNDMWVEGKELIKGLLSCEFAIDPSSKVLRDKLCQYLYQLKPSLKRILVSNPGWYNDVFVLPHKTYGNKKEEEYVIKGPSPSSIPFRGTLYEWQDTLGQYIIDNPILCLVTCAALATPFLYLLNEENFVIHLSGSSSIGKTTAAYLASSIGATKVQSYRTTDNAAESLAKKANDGLLVLDEINQVEAKALYNMVFMLGNGTGKARSNKKGDALPIKTFRNIILSTGEIGLEEKLNEINKTPTAGQSVRFIEISVDAGFGYGIFETLHGFENGEAFSLYIKEAVNQYTGAPLDLLLTRLTQSPKAREESIQFIKERRDEWLKKFVPSEANDQVKRCARKLAFLAAAGELTTFFDILPRHPEEEAREVPFLGKMSDAIDKCFKAWIGQRSNHKDSHEVITAIDRLQAFIQEHGSSRFENTWGVPHEDPWGVTDENPGSVADEKPSLPKNNEKVFNRAGFRKLEETKWVYYVYPEVFYKEISKSKSRQFLNKLAEKGIFVKDPKNRNTVSVYVPGYGSLRLFQIDTDKLGVGMEILPSETISTDLNKDSFDQHHLYNLAKEHKRQFNDLPETPEIII